MNNLRLWAYYYHSLGFNVTHINAQINKAKGAKNPFKSATNDRHKIANIRQSFDEIQKLDWEAADGIGIVLGFNNLRALDFDFYGGCFKSSDYIVKDHYASNDSFIEYVLNLLGLPNGYEWTIKTPSGGFHIIFYAPYHNFALKENLTKAFIPNELTYVNIPLKQIELRWDKHLVLPPSANEKRANYHFYYKTVPQNAPRELTLDKIRNLLNELCYHEYGESYFGYNMYLGFYYGDKDQILKSYAEEFLDFSPVYFKKNSNFKIPLDWLE